MGSDSPTMLRGAGIRSKPPVGTACSRLQVCRGTLAFPGNVGGVNWGSAAYDPTRHIMVANTNRLIAWVKLIPHDKLDAEHHQQQDNRIYGEFGNQEGAPYGLYRTFLFSLRAARRATRRRGEPPKPWIFLPASRCGMFRWARWFPESRLDPSISGDR